MVDILTAAIAYSAVFLLGCVGEIITEKSGHLNLGIPGIMCMGAVGGAWGASIVTQAAGGSPNYVILLLAILLFAFIFSALTGLIYAFLTITLRSNQNITGLALTTFAAGLSQFFMGHVVQRGDATVAQKAVSDASKIIKQGLVTDGFAKLFLSYSSLFYIAIIIAVVAGIVLKRTRIGLHLRAVGENPATADAVGINVTAYKYGAVLTGSGIAGLGGMYYLLVYIGGSWENSATIEALGWICIALVIFTLWKPILSILGAAIFGLLYILAYRIGGNITIDQRYLIETLPYIVTIIVLVVISIIDTKENQPPQALGLPYFREER